MKKLLYTLIFQSFVLLSPNVFATDDHSHQTSSLIKYLGNEGLMVQSGKTKVLFDPFFHNSYGSYTLVPELMREAIFNNKAPYDNITALFISHAHGDHFDETDVISYLLKNKQVNLVAPHQAVKTLEPLEGFEDIKNRITSIELKKGDPAISISVANIDVEAVRIPHAGWPQRADIANIVYRVKMNDDIVVMHMGDADPDKSHFAQHKNFWPKNISDVAFPPYWFSLSASGKELLENVINAEKTIGVHVPTKVPTSLIASGGDYFTTPGEEREIKKSDDESKR